MLILAPPMTATTVIGHSFELDFLLRLGTEFDFNAGSNNTAV